jgi:hypothetical protein
MIFEGLGAVTSAEPSLTGREDTYFMGRWALGWT